MNDPALVPDVISYSAATCACERGQQPQQAKHMHNQAHEAFERTQCNSVISDTISAYPLILTCAAFGLRERSSAPFAEFLTRRLEASMGSYRIGLMECEQRGL